MTGMTRVAPANDIVINGAFIIARSIRVITLRHIIVIAHAVPRCGIADRSM